MECLGVAVKNKKKPDPKAAPGTAPGPRMFGLYIFASSEMYRMSGFAAWSWSADFFGPLGMIVELGSNQMRLLKYHTAGIA